jgi:hypothetical protein
MTTSDKLASMFEGIKHPVSDPQLLSKCIEIKEKFQETIVDFLGMVLMNTFNFTERELIDHWEAFSFNNEQAKPTLGIISIDNYFDSYLVNINKFEHHLNEENNKRYECE